MDSKNMKYIHPDNMPGDHNIFDNNMPKKMGGRGGEDKMIPSDRWIDKEYEPAPLK